MSRIGIFGGSFDPIHLGHVGVAERAMAEHSLDRVLVVPAKICPFKTESGPQMDDDLRWRMVVAACEGHPGLEPCDIELRRGGVSYTIDTVRAVAAANPGAELFFIVGEDSVPGIPMWKESEELQRLCTFKSYPRTPESSTEIRRLFEEGKVVLNPDEKLVKAVREGVVRKGGYCPCRLPKLPEFFCPCDEFKGQLADPSYHGLCHCRLYLKP